MIEQDVLGSLDGIVDPELGVGIVDLGLIYRAGHGASGIEVVMTTTSPSCPLSELLVAQVRAALQRRFPDSTVQISLTWNPPWSPARVSDAARQQLGWSKASARTRTASAWATRIFGRYTRH
jgi:metal-sulfur cluster biosynthetic enzyme